MKVFRSLKFDRRKVQGISLGWGQWFSRRLGDVLVSFWMNSLFGRGIFQVEVYRLEMRVVQRVRWRVYRSGGGERFGEMGVVGSDLGFQVQIVIQFIFRILGNTELVRIGFVLYGYLIRGLIIGNNVSQFCYYFYVIVINNIRRCIMIYVKKKKFQLNYVNSLCGLKYLVILFKICYRK